MKSLSLGQCYIRRKTLQGLVAILSETIRTKEWHKTLIISLIVLRVSDRIVFLCLFILLYVGHQALCVYSGTDWIVEVQLVVEGAFSQRRSGHPPTEEEEAAETEYTDHHQNYSHGDASRPVWSLLHDVGWGGQRHTHTRIKNKALTLSTQKH